MRALSAKVEAAVSRARELVRAGRRSREARGGAWIQPHLETGLALQASWSADLRAGLRAHAVMEQARGVRAIVRRRDEPAVTTSTDHALHSFVSEWDTSSWPAIRRQITPGEPGTEQ